MAEFLLTPLQFGIPNSRLRYYLLAKTAPYKFSTSIQPRTTYRYIPSQDGTSSAWIDPRQDPESVVAENTRDIRHYLDSYSEDVENFPHPHAIPDKVLEKWGGLFDIVLPNAKRTCCFTRGKFAVHISFALNTDH